MVDDLGAFPLLSTSPAGLNSTQLAVLNWIQFGLPADTLLSFMTLAIGLLQIISAYGLWAGTPWSHKSAIFTVVLLPVSWIGGVALYASAPVALGLTLSPQVSGSVSSVIGLWIVLGYLRKPHVKQYLRLLPTSEAPAPSKTMLEDLNLPHLTIAGILSLLFAGYLFTVLASNGFGAAVDTVSFTTIHTLALLMSGYYLIKKLPIGTYLSLLTQLVFVASEVYHFFLNQSAFEGVYAVVGTTIAVFAVLGYRSFLSVKPLPTASEPTAAEPGPSTPI